LKAIPLTKGYVAFVDDDDFAAVSQKKWGAFHSNGNVYAASQTSRKDGPRRTLFMHRIINETPEGLHTDHVDGDTLNNCRSNLRSVTRAQNQWNRRADRQGSSKHKGVSWQASTGKWLAMIQANKRRIYLGIFADEEDAARAYASAAVEMFGEFNRKIEI
jgi:hypothetical protein